MATNSTYSITYPTVPATSTSGSLYANASTSLYATASNSIYSSVTYTMPVMYSEYSFITDTDELEFIEMLRFAINNNSVPMKEKLDELKVIYYLSKEDNG